MERFPQLQSGFLGMAQQQLTRYVPKRDPFKDYTLDQDHMKPSLAYFYHEEATALYRQYNQNRKLGNDLAFVRKVISLAKKLFAAPDGVAITRWFDIQERNINLSKYHAVFLHDTLRFVMLGTPRSMCLETMYSILKHDPSQFRYQGDVSWKNVLPNGLHYGNNMYAANNVIAMWLSQPDGLNDLLTTCNIIYGCRDMIQDVSDKSFS